MKSHYRPEETNMNNSRTIHVQRFHGCSSYDRFAKDVSAIVTPAKMTVPTLPSRIEQSHALACLGVSRCDLRTLRVVANRARVAQVVRRSFASQRPRNDVIDFERFRAQLLSQLTVFATELRLLGDELSKGLRDVCQGRHRQSPCRECSLQLLSRRTSIFGQVHEAFLERPSSRAISSVLRSNWSTNASSSRLSSAMSMPSLPLARSSAMRLRWRVFMRNMPRIGRAASRASSAVGIRSISSSNFRRCGFGNWTIASRSCSSVSSTVAIESPHGKEFTTHPSCTRLTKTRANWDRRSNLSEVTAVLP